MIMKPSFQLVKATLRKGGATLGNLHKSLAGNPAAKNWRGFAALAVIAVIAAGLAQPGPQKTGTLTAPTTVPIVINGKQVGSATVAPGTKVTVVKEDTATGKVLIKASAGEAWVEAANVTLPQLPETSPQETAPKNTAAEVVQPAPTKVEKRIAEPAGRGPAEHIYMLSGPNFLRDWINTDGSPIESFTLAGLQILGRDGGYQPSVALQYNRERPSVRSQQIVSLKNYSPEKTSIIVWGGSPKELEEILQMGWKRVALDYGTAQSLRNAGYTGIPDGIFGEVVVRGHIAVFDGTMGAGNQKEEERYWKGIQKLKVTGPLGEKIKKLWEFLKG